MERLGHDVIIVEGNYDNIKLTTPEDLYFAEAIIKTKRSHNRAIMKGDNSQCFGLDKDLMYINLLKIDR